MRVSFFVQAYNTEAFVAQCLASILEQRGAYDIEVLVIDDASTDGTAREIERFTDERIEIRQHAHNKGAIATANEGYLSVTGELIVRVDSDDRLRPDFLERMVPPLVEEPSRGLAYGDVATIDLAGRVTRPAGLIRRDGRPASGDEFLPLLMENFIPAPSTIVRREALLPLLPIPARFRFLDWYLTTGIAQTWDCCYVDAVVADYRVHAGNMHRAMVLDRTGEATSRQILDRLFAEAVRGAEKARWRRRVYARHYLTYADKYFGFEMNADARRCYWQAISYQPSLAATPGVARRLAATVFGRTVYESAKAHLAGGRG
jgi:glycosyltransferase involved in cell wall biosynthesis